MKASFEVVKGDPDEPSSPEMVGLPLETYEQLKSDADKWGKLVNYYHAEGTDISDLSAKFFDLMAGRA